MLERKNTTSFKEVETWLKINLLTCHETSSSSGAISPWVIQSRVSFKRDLIYQHQYSFLAWTYIMPLNYSLKDESAPLGNLEIHQVDIIKHQKDIELMYVQGGYAEISHGLGSKHRCRSKISFQNILWPSYLASLLLGAKEEGWDWWLWPGPVHFIQTLHWGQLSAGAGEDFQLFWWTWPSGTAVGKQQASDLYSSKMPMPNKIYLRNAEKCLFNI